MGWGTRRGDWPGLESQRLPLGPPSRLRRWGTLAQPRTPSPGSAEPACSAPAGTPSPCSAPAHSATRTSSQRLNPLRPHNVRSGGATPSRVTPHLQRWSVTGRKRSRVQWGAEGSGGGGQNPLRARGADAAPAAATSAREPPASPAARRPRIRTPGRGRAGGGASLSRLLPDPGGA